MPIGKSVRKQMDGLKQMDKDTMGGEGVHGGFVWPLLRAQ